MASKHEQCCKPTTAHDWQRCAHEMGRNKLAGEAEPEGGWGGSSNKHKSPGCVTKGGTQFSVLSELPSWGSPRYTFPLLINCGLLCSLHLSFEFLLSRRQNRRSSEHTTDPVTSFGTMTPIATLVSWLPSPSSLASRAPSV